MIVIHCQLLDVACSGSFFWLTANSTNPVLRLEQKIEVFLSYTKSFLERTITMTLSVTRLTSSKSTNPLTLSVKELKLGNRFG